MTDHSNTPECCPEFDPKPWDHTTHNWINKPFIKDCIKQFLHMPLPSQYAKVIGRMWKKAQDSGAAPEMCKEIRA